MYVNTAGQLLVRVGGGSQPFGELAAQSDRHQQRKLVQYMMDSDQSLEWVLKQHVNNKRIAIAKTEMASKNLSPMRNPSKAKLNAPSPQNRYSTMSKTSARPNTGSQR